MADRTCSTCPHWTPPSERTDFYGPVSFANDEWDDSLDNGFGGNAKADAASRLYGICQAIDLGQDLPDGPPPLAVTQDASNHVASLYTQAEFGCVLHEEKRRG